VLVFLCVSATYGRVIDILRMDDRDYLSDGEETDGEVACDSCCELHEPDTCGDILNKIDEIDDTIEKFCSGEEPEVDEDWIEDCRVVAEEAIPECMERVPGVEDEGDVSEEMDECLQEIIGELVHTYEDPAVTLQVCKCQGFVANRKKLEDASELFCFKEAHRENQGGHLRARRQAIGPDYLPGHSSSSYTTRSPSYLPGHSSYTTGPPAYTTGPPAYTTGPPSYTTGSPAYTTGPPAYTTRSPAYTTRPPAYTTSPPSYTTSPPVYTTDPPSYTTRSLSYLPGHPSYTTGPPSYTTSPPAYTTRSPAYTTSPPAYTTSPPSYTTRSPAYTTGPPAYTTGPPAYTTSPPTYTTGPPAYTTGLPAYTTGPPSYPNPNPAKNNWYIPQEGYGTRHFGVRPSKKYPYPRKTVGVFDSGINN